MLAKFSGVESERTVFKFRKRKKNCVVFAYFVKRAREIRKFHVLVVQRRLRKVQKKRDTRAKLLLCYLNLLLFAVLVAVAVVVA